MAKMFGKKDMSKSWVLRNPETGEVRVALLLTGVLAPIFVVKFFRPKDDLEVFSVKFFIGNVEQTIAHWNTKTEVEGAERAVFIALAFEKLNSLLTIFK